MKYIVVKYTHGMVSEVNLVNAWSFDEAEYKIRSRKDFDLVVAYPIDDINEFHFKMGQVFSLDQVLTE